MNIHQILKTVPPEYHAIARHYVRQFELAGVPTDKIDHLIQWGCSYTGSGEEADILSAFRQQASRLDISDDVTATAADLGLESRERINSGEWQAEPVAADETTQLLADIRAYRKQWPDDYSADRAMQEVELRLIASQLGEDPPALSAPLPTTRNDQRLAEIRQMRRNDPQAYDSSPEIHREELALIEAQLASQGEVQRVRPTNELQPAPAASGETGELPRGNQDDRGASNRMRELRRARDAGRA